MTFTVRFVLSQFIFFFSDGSLSCLFFLFGKTFCSLRIFFRVAHYFGGLSEHYLGGLSTHYLGGLSHYLGGLSSTSTSTPTTMNKCQGNGVILLDRSRNFLYVSLLICLFLFKTVLSVKLKISLRTKFMFHIWKCTSDKDNNTRPFGWNIFEN